MYLIHCFAVWKTSELCSTILFRDWIPLQAKRIKAQDDDIDFEIEKDDGFNEDDGEFYNNELYNSVFYNVHYAYIHLRNVMNLSRIFYFLMRINFDATRET